MKNPAHIENFVSCAAVRFAIIDVTSNPVKGSQYWEVASGKTEEEAKERFYMRYMVRGGIDREMIEVAQKNNRLIMQKIENNSRALVESNLLLIAVL